MDLNLKTPDLKAGLYIIATPIGNLGDISVRALEALSAVDVVYCEDTRVSGKLLQYFGLKKPLKVYNDHSDSGVREAIFEQINDGKCVALISDAGMPLISDPGYKLVHDARLAGICVTSVPGANAPLTALQLSGLPSDRFSFLGFLPSKTKARQDLLRQWQAVPSTLIAFETAPRLIAALEDLQAVMAGRNVAVVREITKKFEEVRCAPVGELLTYYNENGAPKGEIVLVIEPPQYEKIGLEEAEGMLAVALQTMRTKDAAAYVAEKTGFARKELYQMALNISGGE